MLKIPTQIASPKGIDKTIQKLQTYLSANLTWLSHSFSRAYSNKDSEGNEFDEVFVGANDYRDVRPNDTVKAISFFKVADVVSISDQIPSTNIDLIFFINLKKAYPTLTHRADENAINEITILLEKYKPSWQLQTIQKGLDNVYENYTKPIADLQPFFVCSFSFEVYYNYLITCN